MADHPTPPPFTPGTPASDALTAQEREARSFGFRAINPAEKAPLVQGVFSSVASRYDIMNDLMSVGIHRLWKSTFVDLVAPRAGETILDVAGGTGDIAFRMAAKAPSAKIMVCDLTEAMVRVGRDRGIDKGSLPGWDRTEETRGGLHWTVGTPSRAP
ncbi:class I SAM-dependent methyltransferase, partial [Azospirillum sp. B4]|uniref:class I SAM-dependent methyltransferase n=1 Tax=Azospirillum sp. B4 TaxID=95605 RepID=UPI002078F0A9